MQTHRVVALAAVVLAACVNGPPAADQQAQAVVEAEANNSEAAALAAALATLEVEILPNESKSRAAITFRAALAAAAEAEANNDVKVIFQATINAFNAAAAAVKDAKVEAETHYKTAAAASVSAKAAATAALTAYRTTGQDASAIIDSISTAKATKDDAQMAIKAILKFTNARDAYIVAQDTHTAAYATFEAVRKAHQITLIADGDFERFSKDSRNYLRRGLVGYEATQDIYNFAKDYIAAH